MLNLKDLAEQLNKIERDVLRIPAGLLYIFGAADPFRFSKMRLEDVLAGLVKVGCVPSIYRRGNVWRAHVNAAGNHWEENEDVRLALVLAVQTWLRAGAPADGQAVQS